MKKIVVYLLFLLSSVFALGLETPEEILKKSDEKIFPKNFSYDLKVSVEGKNGKIRTEIMSGLKKGDGKNLLIIKEPVRLKGSVHLRKEDSIWMYFNTNGKIMKTAFQSLAMGEDVSYGDILANELSYDYDITRFEEMDNEYLLELKPKPDHKGYAKVKLSIDKKTYLPIKREYYALSGILLKICEFEKLEFGDDGIIKLIKEKLFDPLKVKSNYVELFNIKEMDDIPEKYYNKNQMQYMSQM